MGEITMMVFRGAFDFLSNFYPAMVEFGGICYQKIVRAKFSQNPDLAARLVATGTMPLEEGNDFGDTFWGVDAKTGKGENNLGRILMKIREELRKNPQ